MRWPQVRVGVRAGVRVRAGVTRSVLVLVVVCLGFPGPALLSWLWSVFRSRFWSPYGSLFRSCSLSRSLCLSRSLSLSRSRSLSSSWSCLGPGSRSLSRSRSRSWSGSLFRFWSRSLCPGPSLGVSLCPGLSVPVSVPVPVPVPVPGVSRQREAPGTGSACPTDSCARVPLDFGIPCLF